MCCHFSYTNLVLKIRGFIFLIPNRIWLASFFGWWNIAQKIIIIIIILEFATFVKIHIKLDKGTHFENFIFFLQFIPFMAMSCKTWMKLMSSLFWRCYLVKKNKRMIKRLKASTHIWGCYVFNTIWIYVPCKNLFWNFIPRYIS